MIEFLRRLVGRDQEAVATSRRFERTLRHVDLECTRRAACTCKELVTHSNRLDTLAKRLPTRVPGERLEHADGSA